MPDNVTRFPGPKPTPLRSVSLDELFNDAPAMTQIERQRALLEALNRIELVAAEVKSLRHLVASCIEDPSKDR